MTILVTGGAGFIGANFVSDWLAHTDEPVINLDKLTYTGSLERLSQLEGDKRHIFVQGDIADTQLVGRLLVEHNPRAILNFAAESDVDRSIRRVLEAGKVGEFCNMGGRNEKPNLEIVQTVCALLDEPSLRADSQLYSIQITYVTDRLGHDRRYAIDARKLEREQGWKPVEMFESGIHKWRSGT